MTVHFLRNSLKKLSCRILGANEGRVAAAPRMEPDTETVLRGALGGQLLERNGLNLAALTSEHRGPREERSGGMSSSIKSTF